MGGVHGDPHRFFLQAPAVRICWTSEVTPAGVGIRAKGYPGHRRRLRPGGEGAVGDLPARFVQGTGGGSSGERGRPPASKTGGIKPSRPKSNVPWKLDVVLCHQRTPRCSTQGPGGVPYVRPFGLFPGVLDGGLVTESTEGVVGTGGNTGRGPGPKRM